MFQPTTASGVTEQVQINGKCQTCSNVLLLHLTGTMCDVIGCCSGPYSKVRAA